MGFRDRSLLCKIVLILLVLCFCSDLIGFATPYWRSVDNNGTMSYEGLWDRCPLNEAQACGNSKFAAEEWFRAVRAFSILSWWFFLAALVYVIIFVFFKSDTTALYVAAVYLSFAGAFWALIAFAVYAAHVELKDLNVGFALTVKSFIMGVNIGILGMLDCLGVVGCK